MMHMLFKIGSCGLWLCLCFAQAASNAHSQTVLSPQEQKTKLTHDLDDYVITVRLVPFRIAENVDQYHTVDLGVQYVRAGKAKQTEPKFDLELITVVKARRLNTDLYVVFVIDGREVHFGSNRSAIRNPVPGRPWIGERMVFSISVEDFHKLATAEKLAIKMGSTTVDLNEDARTALKVFAEKMGQLER